MRIDLDALEQALEKADAETESLVEPNVLLNLSEVLALVRAVRAAEKLREVGNARHLAGEDLTSPTWSQAWFDLRTALAPFQKEADDGHS